MLEGAFYPNTWSTPAGSEEPGLDQLWPIDSAETKTSFAPATLSSGAWKGHIQKNKCFASGAV